MTTALEVELKTYAHQKVADHLKYEYERQINTKWKPYINLMVDAQTEALNRQQKLLNDVRTQIQKEIEAAFGLSMLALSVIGGVALSWIAGKIQYNWYPKFGSQLQVRKVKGSYGGIYTDWLIKEPNHDKVWAKIFGDLGKQVAGLGIDKALKVVTPNSREAQNAIQSAASSGQTSFKTRLENALEAEAGITSDAIMSLANSIAENDNYGAECLEKLKRLNPNAFNSKVTEKQRELLAKKMIRDDIDRQRQLWADQWFYYGYDPGTTTGIADDIEQEMWGLWILNEKLQAKTKSVSGSMDSSIEVIIHYAEGATFGEYGVPEAVLRRLADFDIVQARTKLQQINNTAARGVREQQDAARKRKYDQEDQVAAGAYRKAMEDAEGADDPASERAYITRQKYEADKRVQAKRAQEKPDEPPDIEIIGTVDTKAEIDALESWAENHSVVQMRHTKRTLESIENIYPR
jgi:hypothetical protein